MQTEEYTYRCKHIAEKWGEIYFTQVLSDSQMENLISDCDKQEVDRFDVLKEICTIHNNKKQ